MDSQTSSDLFSFLGFFFVMFTPRQSVYHVLFRGDERFVAWGECLLVRDRVTQAPERDI